MTRLQQTKMSQFGLTRRRLADLKAAGSDVSSSSVTYAGRTVTLGSGAHVSRRLARVLHVFALIVRAYV